MEGTSEMRRKFLKQGGGLAVGAVALATGVVAAEASEKRQKIISMQKLKPNEAISFEYPGKSAAILIDLGKPVAGGIGPNKSIVAFSALCQHMGCTVDYKSKNNTLVCPCHASVFDVSRNGVTTEGPSTRGLPQISLTISSGNIYATGIMSGLVYGRACNS
jgi:arsenite oxidase small subunit